VVATRSGGPEEIVGDESGRLVPVDDVAALAAGIERVLECGTTYDSWLMHRSIVSRFGSAAVGDRIAELYAEALTGPGRASGVGERHQAGTS
jgi:glycosyltransferase involved in cell wall biosynthesis